MPRRAVIVWMPCERVSCGEAFALGSKKPNQRYCSPACAKARPYDTSLYMSPIYRRWADMKTRCSNPRYKQYADYGGRGIKVCERWQAFSNFLEDMGPTFAPELTLDRIDFDGDYCPENCRWASWHIQANNKRNSKTIEFEGESHPLKEWAQIKGLRPGTVRQRYYTHGWPIERCLTEGVLR